MAQVPPSDIFTRVSGNVPTALRPSCRTPVRRRAFGCGLPLISTVRPTWQTRPGSLASQTQASAERSRIFDGTCRCSSRGPGATSFRR